MDTWDKQMLTQCRLRKAVIIHGNTGDVFFDDSALDPARHYTRNCGRSVRLVYNVE